jgi:outer membrane protein assembly factor BamA
VGVRLISPEVSEPVKDVVVDLKERPRMLAEVGGGYFLVDGPRVVGDVTFPNLGGRGTTVSGRGKINYVGASAPAASGQLKDVQGFRGLGGRANVAIQQPRFYSLLPLEIGGRVDLIGERVFSPSYRFARGAAVLGADWTLTRWLTFSLQYELEYDVVRAPATISRLLPTLTRLEQERLRFPVGEFAIHSLRPQLLFDFRDNPFNPRSGYLFSLTTEFSHDLYTRLTDASGQPLRDASGAEQQFPILTAKVVAQATAYAPLGSRVVLAVSARAGRIYTLNDNPNVLGPKRFFLGGGATMRGFREDGVIPADTRRRLRQQLTACRSVVNPYGCASEADVLQAGDEIPSEGGTLFTLGKVELRIPVVRSLSLGLFGEAGNLWADPALFSFWELRYVLGTGLRFETPIGPLAFDVGFNIDPDRLLNEPTFNINFGVGVF